MAYSNRLIKKYSKQSKLFQKLKLDKTEFIISIRMLQIQNQQQTYLRLKISYTNNNLSNLASDVRLFKTYIQ